MNLSQNFILLLLQTFLKKFMEKKSSPVLYGVFDDFSWSYEVEKFWIIKWCLKQHIFFVKELYF